MTTKHPSLLCAALLAAVVSGCGSDSSSDTGETITKPPAGKPDNGNSLRTEELTFTDQDASSIEARYGAEVEPRARFTFDDGLLPQQSLAVKNDLLELANMSFATSANSTPNVNPRDVPLKTVQDATGAFGTPDATGILNFVSERVKVFLGAEPKATLLQDTSVSPLGVFFSAMRTGESDKAFMTAANFGTLVWYESLIRKQPTAALGATNTYPVSSMRDGLISIQPGYNLVALPTDADGNVVRVRLAGAATLVHEARHSDCSEALTPSDIARIQESGGDVLAGNPKCGHLHVACPPGHELAGISACDQHPWGAYSLSYVYSSFVAQACTSCTDFELRVAALAAIDAYGRVLTFPKDSNANTGTPLNIPLASPAVLPAADMTHRETPR